MLFAARRITVLPPCLDSDAAAQLQFVHAADHGLHRDDAAGVNDSDSEITRRMRARLITAGPFAPSSLMLGANDAPDARRAPGNTRSATKSTMSRGLQGKTLRMKPAVWIAI